MKKITRFLMSVFVCSCIANEQEDEIVDSHEEPLTYNYTGTNNVDRICIHSTWNLAFGTKSWICGNNRIAIDITGFDKIRVRGEKGDDTLIVRASSTSTPVCSCSCDTDSAYGSVIDYVYPNDNENNSIVDFMDTPTQASSFSGNDKIFAGHGYTSASLYTGLNTYRGSPWKDAVAGGDGTVSAGAGTDQVWDPGGVSLNDFYFLRANNDIIYDGDCGWSACDLGVDGADIVNDCVDECVNFEMHGNMAMPGCPALPFP